MSAAYYALFHLLIQDAAGRLTKWPGLQPLVARKFDHGQMKQASIQFGAKKQSASPSGPLPSSFSQLAGVVPTDLKLVAETFQDLYDKRQRADYDPRTDADFTRSEALEAVGRARTAFAAWANTRDELTAEAYLLAMLFRDSGR